MKEVKPVEKNIDEIAMKIFLKTIEIAGGPRKLIERRHLTWVPSLIQASYAILLHENGKTAEEIASFLGTGTQSVRNILRADTEEVKKKLEKSMEEDEEIKTHIAGGLAKLAYKEIKEELPSNL